MGNPAYAEAMSSSGPLAARDAREMQLVVTGEYVDHHHPVTFRDDTLLARLQDDVRANRPAGEPSLVEMTDKAAVSADTVIPGGRVYPIDTQDVPSERVAAARALSFCRRVEPFFGSR